MDRPEELAESPSELLRIYPAHSVILQSSRALSGEPVFWKVPDQFFERRNCRSKGLAFQIGHSDLIQLLCSRKRRHFTGSMSSRPGSLGGFLAPASAWVSSQSVPIVLRKETHFARLPVVRRPQAPTRGHQLVLWTPSFLPRALALLPQPRRTARRGRGDRSIFHSMNLPVFIEGLENERGNFRSGQSDILLSLLLLSFCRLLFLGLQGLRNRSTGAPLIPPLRSVFRTEPGRQAEHEGFPLSPAYSTTWKGLAMKQLRDFDSELEFFSRLL